MTHPTSRETAGSFGGPPFFLPLLIQHLFAAAESGEDFTGFSFFFFSFPLFLRRRISCLSCAAFSCAFFLFFSCPHLPSEAPPKENPRARSFRAPFPFFPPFYLSHKVSNDSTNHRRIWLLHPSPSSPSLPFFSFRTGLHPLHETVTALPPFPPFSPSAQSLCTPSPFFWAPQTTIVVHL